MGKYSFCPNCQIGLNSREMEMRFCQNCKHDWDDDEEHDDEFIEREFTITEYSIGDWGDLGKRIGTIKAIDKYSAKNKFQKLKNISDYEIAFYSFD